MMSDGPWYDSASTKRLRRLRHLRAEGDPRDVDVAVHVRQQAEVLLADRLARGGELGGRAERRRLRRLAAGVRVHLGVDDQDVDVAPVRQHVIEAAVADVVRPAVAADEPHALLHEVVGERFEPARLGACSSAAELVAAARRRARAAPRCRPRSTDPRRAAPSPGRRRPAARGAATSAARRRDVRVERQPEAEPELRVVLEQRVRPRRSAAVAVGRVRRRRQVAAVDRRAAGGVGDEQPVAEELRQQLQVRRLAAARARARVLEQRLEELRALVIELRVSSVRSSSGRLRKKS